MSQFLPLKDAHKLLAQYETDPVYEKRRKAWLRTAAMLTPLRGLERLLWGKRIRETKIPPSPLFLIGFGRSGTTHLHNLMWQDPQFGGVTNYQASMHSIALTGRKWLPKLIAGAMPATRPMDNVAVTLDGPQEEEMAMINYTSHAPIHALMFPKNAQEIYDRYVVNLEDNPDTNAAWQAAYLEVLKKSVLLTNAQRLVLKTPPNTARIPAILKMFPDAKFVYIVRNPYNVFVSIRNLYKKVLPDATLQEIDWDKIEDWFIYSYKAQIEKYLTTRGLIPDGNLVEIKFEDLDQKPLETLAQVYKELSLADFATVKSAMTDYLESLGKFKKNTFQMPQADIDTVNKHWAFAFEAFGYKQTL